MNHEDFKELCALQLYGELDEAQTQLLHAHLRACDACRRFDAELQRGLGALREPHSTPERRASAGELPADWSKRLEAVTRVRSSPRRSLFALAAAAGFVGGMLVMRAWTQRAQPAHAPVIVALDRSALESSYRRFEGSTTPPRASNGGQLARLATYLAR